jgi:hypothetical protein
VRTLGSSGWEPYDARLVGSSFVYGELVTSSAPVGWVQLRIRSRLRPLPLAVLAVVAVVALLGHPLAGAAVALLGVLELARGFARTRTVLDRALDHARTGGVP